MIESTLCRLRNFLRLSTSDQAYPTVFANKFNVVIAKHTASIRFFEEMEITKNSTGEKEYGRHFRGGVIMSRDNVRELIQLLEELEESYDESV